MDNEIAILQQQVYRFKCNYQIAMLFNKLYRTDKSVVDYFVKSKYNKIAIYGMGDFGKMLYSELMNSEVSVAFIIDKQPDKLKQLYSVPVISPDDETMDTDAIIVTTVSVIEDVQDILHRRYMIPVISLEEVLEECL